VTAARRFATAAFLAACTVGAQAAPRTALKTAPKAEPTAADVSIGLKRDAALAAALADLSALRIRQTDSVLVSFGTRNTMSDTVSEDHGIGAARRYLYRELRAYSRECSGCLRVEYDPAMIVNTRHPQRVTMNVVNVLAWLPGRDTTRVIVMGGHYDSCICKINTNDSTSTAPGADDDGSGASAVLELARVMSKRYPKGLDATIVFALYAAEEQGTLGSAHLALRLKDEGFTVVAGMTDDIVGNVTAENGKTDSTSVRIYAVDSVPSLSGELARYVWGLGQVYLPRFEVRPTFRLDRLGRSGDHGPFQRTGAPALRFTERLENYKRQHLPTDEFRFVNFGYTANIARLNFATVASLAAAPPPPDSARQLRDTVSGGQDWDLTWPAVPGAASYEVLVRSTVQPTYVRVIPVEGTTFLLDEELDDAVAAVRAVGPTGARSLTRVFQLARRAPAAAAPPPAP
jgi:Peptidase family M28